MAGLIVPSVQKAKLDAAKATTTNAKTTGGYSGIPAVIAKPAAPTFSQSLNLYGTPASGGYSGIPFTPAKPTTNKAPTVGKTTGATNTFIPGYMPPDTGEGGGGGAPAAPEKTVVSRIPKTDSKGKIIGWTVTYSDGSVSWEDNPEYGKQDTSTSNPAYATISKILESYGITDLASVLEQIRLEYPEASSDDIVTLLQFDDRYNAKFNQRFSANLERQKAGMSVLSPADYLAMEQGYKSTLSAYGLTNFNTQAYYNKFIANDLKVTDIADRVSLAFDRVMNDEMVTNTFKKFYPSLTTVDIVSGMLDPANQFPALERKVKAAEIGGAALRQGIIATELGSMETNIGSAYTNVNRGTVGADVLGQMGTTKAEAEKGYKTIAELLPTAEKLSSIYGGTEDQYGLLQAEQENLQGLASAKRKRERLTAIEMAQFGKKSGLAQGALSSQTNI